MGRAIVAVCATIVAPLHALAASGTWSADASGPWSDSTKWDGGVVPSDYSAARFICDLTADRTVTLDAQRVVSELVFSDSSPATAFNWLLSTTTSQTLALSSSGSPTITVNAMGAGKSAIVSLVMTGSQGLTKDGPGTLTLRKQNTYTGRTVVRGGTLLLDQPGGRALASGGALTLAGGTLAMRTGSSGGTQVLGDLTLEANSASTIILDPNNNTYGYSTQLTLGSNWTRSNKGSTLLLDYSAPGAGSRYVYTDAAVPGTTNKFIPYALVKDAGGIGFATRVEAGADTGHIVRATTGFTTLSSGKTVSTANYNTSGSTYTGGVISLTAGSAVGTLTIDTSTRSGTIDLGASTNVLGLGSGTYPGGILFLGGGDERITGGQLGSNGREVIVHQMGAGRLTIQSRIAGDDSGGSFIKAGDGVVVLESAENIYKGPTAVTGGTLLVNGAHSNGGAYSVGRGATLGGSGSIATGNGAGVTIAAGGHLAPGASAGTLQLSLASGTLDLSAALAEEASGALLFELGPLDGSDRVSLLSGSANIGQGVLDFGDFAFTPLPGLQRGTYTLIGGSISGTLASSGLSGPLGTGTGTLSLGTEGLLLTVQLPEPTAAGMLALASTLLLRRRRGTGSAGTPR